MGRLVLATFDSTCTGWSSSSAVKGEEGESPAVTWQMGHRKTQLTGVLAVAHASLCGCDGDGGSSPGTPSLSHALSEGFWVLGLGFRV